MSDEEEGNPEQGGPNSLRVRGKPCDGRERLLTEQAVVIREIEVPIQNEGPGDRVVPHPVRADQMVVDPWQRDRGHKNDRAQEPGKEEPYFGSCADRPSQLGSRRGLIPLRAASRSRSALSTSFGTICWSRCAYHAACASDPS